MTYRSEAVEAFSLSGAAPPIPDLRVALARAPKHPLGLPDKPTARLPTEADTRRIVAEMINELGPIRREKVAVLGVLTNQRIPDQQPAVLVRFDDVVMVREVGRGGRTLLAFGVDLQTKRHSGPKFQLAGPAVHSKAEVGALVGTIQSWRYQQKTIPDTTAMLVVAQDMIQRMSEGDRELAQPTEPKPDFSSEQVDIMNALLGTLLHGKVTSFNPDTVLVGMYSDPHLEISNPPSGLSPSI